MPLVSVIIPTYNAAKFICQAVNSVLEQSLRDVEVIVVDDGSTDETPRVAESWTDPRVKYIRQPHSERSVARNTGIAHSSSPYIALLDADDWWGPAKLEKQVALLQSHAELGVVYCWLQQVGPSGERLRLMQGFLEPDDATGARVLERLLLNNVPGPGTSAVIPRRCIEEVGGFKPDVSYVEDWDLCLRLASRFPFGFVPEALAYYRLHGNYMPRKMHQLNVPLAGTRIIERALAFAGLPAESPLGRKAVAKMLYYGSLMDAGVGEYESSNERLAQAMTLDSEPFSGNLPPFVEFVAYFSNLLYDTITPLDEALSFVRGFFDNLKGEPGRLKRFRRATLGWTCAISAFEGRDMRSPERVRRSFWRAFVYDPRWLKNLGLLSIGLKACTGIGNGSGQIV